ncbi:MAG: hypothetical protein KGD59_15430 [Candidatus Heimdallarchaeota archaeon]|nr:hypothetical protein [Candidatus Heimdallarchaeota archaeon]MBY8995940.1 hypothetical protein [Candidatus Heimdallarchaeota archaeon]
MKNRSKVRKNSFSALLKLLCICTLFLFVSINNATVLGEGFFVLKEVNPSLLNEGESGHVLCEQDGFLYLIKYGSTQIDSIRIVDVQQPENPIIVGSYQLELSEDLLDFKISENTGYMLTELKGIFSPFRFSVSTLNITDPTNPVRVGSSALEHISTIGVNSSEHISIYNNYTYVSSNELLIFDCSNQTLPVKVANYTSTGGELHVKNDYLYLVWNGVKIYSLADPVNPLFLGEVNSTKHSTTSSGLYGNYVINTFQESGIQSFNCTDPMQPTICGEYDFIDENIQDMDIVGDRLFTEGRKLYVFDISDPKILKRIARKNIGNQNIGRITVANNYMYLTIDGTIRIYSYIENSLGRNLGLGIGIGVGLPVVVGASLVFLWKKKRG